MQAGVNTVKGNSYYIKVFQALLNATSSNLYTCQTVEGLIWGYTDSLLEALYNMGFISSKVRLQYAYMLRGITILYTSTHHNIQEDPCMELGRACMELRRACVKLGRACMKRKRVSYKDENNLAKVYFKG